MYNILSLNNVVFTDMRQLERGGGYPFMWWNGKLTTGDTKDTHYDLLEQHPGKTIGPGARSNGRVSVDGSIMAFWSPLEHSDMAADVLFDLRQAGHVHNDTVVKYLFAGPGSGKTVGELLGNAASSGSGALSKLSFETNPFEQIKQAIRQIDWATWQNAIMQARSYELTQTFYRPLLSVSAMRHAFVGYVNLDPDDIEINFKTDRGQYPDVTLDQLRNFAIMTIAESIPNDLTVKVREPDPEHYPVGYKGWFSLYLKSVEWPNVSALRFGGLESRIPIFMQKYPDVPDETIREINALDPTGEAAIYTEWLIRQVLRDKRVLKNWSEEVRSALHYFDKHKDLSSWTLPKDINQYDSYEYFDLLVSDVMEKGLESTREEIRKIKERGAEHIYDDGTYMVVKITSPDACVYYGKGTKWCVSRFTDAVRYLEKGPLYAIFKDGAPVAMYTGHGDQLMSPAGEFLEFVTPDPELANVMVDSIMGGADTIEDDPVRSLWYYRYVVDGSPDPYVRLVQTSPKGHFYNHALEGTLSEQGYETIAQDPYWSSMLAAHVLKGRFPEGEAAISQDPMYSYWYARHMVGGRWPKGEAVIMQDPVWKQKYEQDILGSTVESARYRYQNGWLSPDGTFYPNKNITHAVDAKYLVHQHYPDVAAELTHDSYAPEGYLVNKGWVRVAENWPDALVLFTKNKDAARDSIVEFVSAVPRSRKLHVDYGDDRHYAGTVEEFLEHDVTSSLRRLSFDTAVPIDDIDKFVEWLYRQIDWKAWKEFFDIRNNMGRRNFIYVSEYRSDQDDDWKGSLVIHNPAGDKMDIVGFDVPTTILNMRLLDKVSMALNDMTSDFHIEWAGGSSDSPISIRRARPGWASLQFSNLKKSLLDVRPAVDYVLNVLEQYKDTVLTKSTSELLHILNVVFLEYVYIDNFPIRIVFRLDRDNTLFRLFYTGGEMAPEIHDDVKIFVIALDLSENIELLRNDNWGEFIQETTEVLSHELHHVAQLSRDTTMWDKLDKDELFQQYDTSPPPKEIGPIYDKWYRQYLQHPLEIDAFARNTAQELVNTGYGKKDLNDFFASSDDRGTHRWIQDYVDMARQDDDAGKKFLKRLYQYMDQIEPRASLRFSAVQNAWIEPNGNVIMIGAEEHYKAAQTIAKARYGLHDTAGSSPYSAYVELVRRGYVRVGYVRGRVYMELNDAKASARSSVVEYVSRLDPNESLFVVAMTGQQLHDGPAGEFLQHNVLGTLDKHPDGDYPLANDIVDGLVVRQYVPNTSSINASLAHYEILDGIREVPMNHFDLREQYVAHDDIAHYRDLADKIKESGEMTPLIVVVDQDGPYVLEGGHRLSALNLLGKTAFPALVVLDLDVVTTSLRFGALEDELFSPPPAREYLDDRDLSQYLQFHSDSMPFFYNVDKDKLYVGPERHLHRTPLSDTIMVSGRVATNGAKTIISDTDIDGHDLDHDTIMSVAFSLVENGHLDRDGLVGIYSYDTEINFVPMSEIGGTASSLRFGQYLNPNDIFESGGGHAFMLYRDKLYISELKQQTHDDVIIGQIMGYDSDHYEWGRDSLDDDDDYNEFNRILSEAKASGRFDSWGISFWFPYEFDDTVADVLFRLVQNGDIGDTAAVYLLGHQQKIKSIREWLSPTESSLRLGFDTRVPAQTPEHFANAIVAEIDFEAWTRYLDDDTYDQAAIVFLQYGVDDQFGDIDVHVDIRPSPDVESYIKKNAYFPKDFDIERYIELLKLYIYHEINSRGLPLSVGRVEEIYGGDIGHTVTIRRTDVAKESNKNLPYRTASERLSFDVASLYLRNIEQNIEQNLGIQVDDWNDVEYRVSVDLYGTADTVGGGIMEHRIVNIEKDHYHTIDVDEPFYTVTWWLRHDADEFMNFFQNIARHPTIIDDGIYMSIDIPSSGHYDIVNDWGDLRYLGFLAHGTESSLKLGFETIPPLHDASLFAQWLFSRFDEQEWLRRSEERPGGYTLVSFHVDASGPSLQIETRNPNLDDCEFYAAPEKNLPDNIKFHRHGNELYFGNAWGQFLYDVADDLHKMLPDWNFSVSSPLGKNANISIRYSPRPAPRDQYRDITGTLTPDDIYDEGVGIPFVDHDGKVLFGDDQHTHSMQLAEKLFKVLPEHYDYMALTETQRNVLDNALYTATVRGRYDDDDIAFWDPPEYNDDVADLLFDLLRRNEINRDTNVHLPHGATKTVDQYLGGPLAFGQHRGEKFSTMWDTLHRTGLPWQHDGVELYVADDDATTHLQEFGPDVKKHEGRVSFDGTIVLFYNDVDSEGIADVVLDMYDKGLVEHDTTFYFPDNKRNVEVQYSWDELRSKLMGTSSALKFGFDTALPNDDAVMRHIDWDAWDKYMRQHGDAASAGERTVMAISLQSAPDHDDKTVVMMLTPYPDAPYSDTVTYRAAVSNDFDIYAYVEKIKTSIKSSSFTNDYGFVPVTIPYWHENHDIALLPRDTALPKSSTNVSRNILSLRNVESFETTVPLGSAEHFARYIADRIDWTAWQDHYAEHDLDYVTSVIFDTKLQYSAVDDMLATRLVIYSVPEHREDIIVEYPVKTIDEHYLETAEQYLARDAALHGFKVSIDIGRPDVFGTITKLPPDETIGSLQIQSFDTSVPIHDHDAMVRWIVDRIDTDAWNKLQSDMYGKNMVLGAIYNESVMLNVIEHPYDDVQHYKAYIEKPNTVPQEQWRGHVLSIVEDVSDIVVRDLPDVAVQFRPSIYGNQFGITVKRSSMFASGPDPQIVTNMMLGKHGYPFVMALGNVTVGDDEQSHDNMVAEHNVPHPRPTYGRVSTNGQYVAFWKPTIFNKDDDDIANTVFELMNRNHIGIDTKFYFAGDPQNSGEVWQELQGLHDE